MSLLERLQDFVEDFLAAAQESYNRWEGDDGSGICGRIANYWGNLLWGTPGIRVRAKDHGRFSDPGHTTLWVTDGTEVVEVDLPYFHYESFGVHPQSPLGMGWTKKQGVVFGVQHIVFKTVHSQDAVAWKSEKAAVAA